jgi:hypothetical protein
MGGSGRGVEPVTEPDDPMDDFKLRIDLHITADRQVDFLPDFLDVLRSRAARAGVADRTEAVNASMHAPPIEHGSLDAIWSEGAIYNMRLGPLNQ